MDDVSKLGEPNGWGSKLDEDGVALLCYHKI